MEKRSKESMEQRKKYIKRKRELCIALGVCRECMCRDALPGIKMCKQCSDKAKLRTKADRNWYKQHGICTECRQEKALEGKLICANCSKVDTLSYSTIYIQGYKPVNISKPKMWREQGLCYQCGEKTLPGRKQCKKHYEISKMQAEKLNKDSINHIWRKLSDLDVAKKLNEI